MRGRERRNSGSEDPLSHCLAKGSWEPVRHQTISFPSRMVSTPKGASSGPLDCPDFLRRPRAALSVRTGAHVFANTGCFGFRPRPRTWLSSAAGARRFLYARRRSDRFTRCTVLSQRPKAPVPFHTVALVLPNTGTMVPGCVRRYCPFPPQVRLVPPASEDAGFPRRGCTFTSGCPRTPIGSCAVRSLFPASEDTGSIHRGCTITSGCPRTPVSSCAVCTVFHRCPKAAVSVRTACWVPPALARWFPTAPEDAAVRRRSCVSFPLHPKMRGFLDAVRFPNPLSENAGKVLRGARSFTSTRGQRFPSARRAGFDLYRVLWFLSASEDASFRLSVRS